MKTKHLTQDAMNGKGRNSTGRKRLHLSYCITLTLAILFSLSTGMAAQQQAPFRVMCWNVENLFDIRHDSLKNDYEFLPEALRHWNYGRYRKKLSNMARVITAVGEWTPPALIGLCEVENDSVMHDLVHYTPLKEHGYRYVMTDSPDERGIDVALLYQRDRFKLLSYRSIPVGTFNIHSRPTRDILHTCGLLSTGDTLDVFVAHLPSRSGGVKYSEPYRLFVAKKIRKEADSILNIRHRPQLIIMGDFNDYPEDKSISEVLAATSPPVHPEPLKLYHLLAGKAKADKQNFGSYKYQGEWGLLDHLIVSGTLLDTSGTFFTNERKADVARLPFLLIKDEKYGGVQPFRTFYGMKYQGGYSDHLPIYVDFEITTANSN